MIQVDNYSLKCEEFQPCSATAQFISQEFGSGNDVMGGDEECDDKTSPCFYNCRIKHHFVSIIIEYMKVKLFLLKGKVISLVTCVFNAWKRR